MSPRGPTPLLAVFLGLTVTRVVVDRQARRQDRHRRQGLRVVLVLRHRRYLGPQSVEPGGSEDHRSGRPGDRAVAGCHAAGPAAVPARPVLRHVLGARSRSRLFYLILRCTHTGTEVGGRLRRGLAAPVGRSAPRHRQRRPRRRDADVLRKRTHLPRAALGAAVAGGDDGGAARRRESCSSSASGLAGLAIASRELSAGNEGEEGVDGGFERAGVSLHLREKQAALEGGEQRHREVVGGNASRRGRRPAGP